MKKYSEKLFEMKAVFDILAKPESDDATEYCNLEVPGLGARFRDEIKQAVRRICEYPEAWTKKKEDIRRYILHRFPYKILYSIESDHIYIIAIAHCHRQPDYWVDRIM